MRIFSATFSAWSRRTTERPWPTQYGVVGDYVPNGFLKQLAFPFRWKG
jgi:hypothetical protein